MSTSYKQGAETHPVIPFQRDCKVCELSSGKAVNGCGPDDLTKVRLIVISDHTGHYEEEENYTFVSNDDRRIPLKRKNGRMRPEGFRNAGSTLRHELRKLGLDSYEEVWLTNAIKCNPAQVKPQEKHAKLCTRTWLKQELALLDEYCPKVPILIAGSIAYKSLQELAPELKTSLPKLRDCRRTNHYKFRNHPLVFTYNPAAVKPFRIETQYQTNRDFTLDVTQVMDIEPPIIGSPIWHFRKDLEFLIPFL